MLVNDLLIDALKSSSYPKEIKQNILNPTKNDVFSTLFFFMYNGVLRELVNKFYCIFIANDVDMSAIEIRHLFEIHKSKTYFSIHKQRYVTPSHVDISAIYHIYTPFYCDEDDVEPNNPCRDFAPPRVQIVQYPENSNSVNATGALFLKVVVTSNTFDGSYTDYNYKVDGAEVIDYDESTDEFILVPHADATRVRITIRTSSNCKGSGFAIREWNVITSEDNYTGVRIICEGDPPYTNTAILIDNDFPDNPDCTVNHYLQRCDTGEGEWLEIAPDFNQAGDPIEGGMVHAPFAAIRDQGDGNLLLKPEITDVLCSDFDRFTIKSVRQCSSAITTNYHPLDNMPFHPYLWFMKRTVTTFGLFGDDITILPPYSLEEYQEIDYWLHTKEYHNEYPLKDFLDKQVHGETWKIYLSPSAIDEFPTWPTFIFGMPKAPFSGKCDMANIIPISGFYPESITFADLKVHVKKVDVYSIFTTFESVVQMNGEGEVEPQYNAEDHTYMFDLDMPSDINKVVQYRIRFDFKCIRYYVNLLLHYGQMRHLQAVPTLNSPDSNQRIYQLSVVEDGRDVSDEYNFTISSNLDGDVTPDTTGTVSGAVFELLSEGLHNLLFTAVPKLPYFQVPTLTLQDLVQKPSFNICVPDIIGNLIDSFRDEYLLSPCLTESDQFRIDAGMPAFKWSDHLSYAALRHAYYLEQNGPREHNSGGHYELSGLPGFFAEQIGQRVTASNYIFLGCAEGISAQPDFCSHFNLFKSEFDGDPQSAGHFSPWVRPPNENNYYHEDIGYARVGNWSVTVYGTPRSLAGQVPDIPAEINTGFPISTETSFYRSDSFFLQTCLKTSVETDSPHPVVQWVSNIDGNITEAVSISDTTALLSPGTHTITAFFYYNGQKLSDTTTITILPACELVAATEVTPAVAQLQFEQCTIGMNEYRVNNGFTALELNDYLIQECQRHAYYCHLHNRDYSGNEDISLSFTGGVETPRERAKLLGYKSFSYHFAVVDATNYCDAWYKIENNLTMGRPPLHHYDSSLYEHCGIGSYGNYTCIAMASLNKYTIPLVPISIPYQSLNQPQSTYVFGFTDPGNGQPLTTEWTSSLQGTLGTSTTLESGDSNVQLIPGEHMITAVAQTSCGESSKTFPVTITPVPLISITLAGQLDSYLFTVTDANNLADLSTASWSSSLQGLLDSGEVIRDETETIVLLEGTHSITVSVVYDGVTYTATDVFTYELSPPLVLSYNQGFQDLRATSPRGLDLSTGEWFGDYSPTALPQNTVSGRQCFRPFGSLNDLRTFIYKVTVDNVLYQESIIIDFTSSYIHRNSYQYVKDVATGLYLTISTNNAFLSASGSLIKFWNIAGDSLYCQYNVSNIVIQIINANPNVIFNNAGYVELKNPNFMGSKLNPVRINELLVIGEYPRMNDQFQLLMSNGEFIHFTTTGFSRDLIGPGNVFCYEYPIETYTH
jgi:uncharacterized protein YkwD